MVRTIDDSAPMSDDVAKPLAQQHPSAKSPASKCIAVVTAVGLGLSALAGCASRGSHASSHPTAPPSTPLTGTASTYRGPAHPPPLTSAPSAPGTPTGDSSTSVSPPPAGLDALRGHTVVVDPGHDGGNGAHPSDINRPVPDGVGNKPCDTTGAETADGYPEHEFTWDVAQRLKAILEANGATVVLTRNDDEGVGPCVNERAAIGNEHQGAAGVSIHADGGPTGADGFHVIRPAGVSGVNTEIVAPSERLGAAVRDAYAEGTGEPFATYVGATQGIAARNDLGGLNLSKIPKVFVECLNMRSTADASRAENPTYRQRVAQALAEGLARYFG